MGILGRWILAGFALMLAIPAGALVLGEPGLAGVPDALVALDAFGTAGDQPGDPAQQR